MALIPASLVPPPEPRAIRYGLLAAANGPLPLDNPVQGLGGGIVYDPVSCGVAHTYPIECDDTPPAKTFDPSDDHVTASPFLVYASLQCGSVGYTTAELEDKVRRRLAAGEQTQAEAALADILATDVAANPANALTSADDTSIVAAVAELEQWLYDHYGHVGYLHAPARAAAYAMDRGLIVEDGPIKRTALGTVWVFGGGYDDGLLYITGQTTVWRAETVQVIPAAQTFDRAANQHYLLAEREYAVAYDCDAASVPLDLGGVS